jgi:hypothetical protein
VNRRGFLQAIIGAAAAPVVAAIASYVGPALIGEGTPEGAELDWVRSGAGWTVIDQRAAKVWAKALYAEAAKESYFSKFLEGQNALITRERA